MLRLENITKSFDAGPDHLDVLRGINLTVGEGEIVAIIGPSGVGKSTLLHIMGALDTPTTGKVYVRGTDVFALPEVERAAFRNRTVGFVFQFHHLLRELTALENVMMPCLIGGMGRDEAAARAEELLGGRPARRTGRATGRESSPAARSSAPRSRGRWQPGR